MTPRNVAASANSNAPHDRHDARERDLPADPTRRPEQVEHPPDVGRRDREHGRAEDQSRSGSDASTRDASTRRSSLNGPPRARAAVGSPPTSSAAAASSAGMISRSSRGGGKYSSSSVLRTSMTLPGGTHFANTAAT